MQTLSLEQKQQYIEQGYCSPIDVMSEDEAMSIHASLQNAEVEYAEEIHAENRNNAHLVLTCLDKAVFHPTITGAVQDLLGPDILLWGSVLFIKEPQTSGFVSWHQDATYMGLEPHDYLTPWLALSPSNSLSGCMSVIPGSHHSPIQDHSDTYEENNILTRGQKIKNVDENAAVDLVLRPGQMSIHHPRLIHGSRPNKSQQRRVGLAIQSYITPAVHQTAGEAYAIKVSGDVSNSPFYLSERPTEDMSPADIAWRNKVNKNLAEILYRGAESKRAY